MTTMIGRGPIPPNQPMPAKTTPTLGPSCVCKDPDLERLRALVAAGMDQRVASRLIWCPPEPVPPAPAPALIQLDPGLFARRTVRHVLATRLPWLRLPASEVS